MGWMDGSHKAGEAPAFQAAALPSWVTAKGEQI